MKRYTTEERENLAAMIGSADLSSAFLACQILINNEGEYTLQGAVSIYTAVVNKMAVIRTYSMLGNGEREKWGGVYLMLARIRDVTWKDRWTEEW